MTPLDKLKQKVHELYTSNNPNADPWNFWGYPNHVLIVAKNAEELAKRFNSNVDFCVAGALLHDIADVEMLRANPDHEQRSLELARELLKDVGFGESEIVEIVDKIIAPHSCRKTFPETLEGKVLATADAMAHFQTDFYPFFAWQHYGSKDYEGFKAWLLKKIEKDFCKKIFFDEVKAEIREDYIAIRRVYSKSY